jgi:hypothetical protein
MLDPTNVDALRPIFMLPSRWDPHIARPDGMPALGAGLLDRLRSDAGWADVEFDNLEEYRNFRNALADGSLALPAPDMPLQSWYAGLLMIYPAVYRAANFVLTITFANTDVS